MTSDADLVAQYRAARAHELFAQMVERHGAMVLRTCLRSAGNLADAEDAAQTTFQTLAQRPEAVNAPLGVWLHGQARRAACDLVRGRVRRARREQEAARMKQNGNRAGLPADDLALREELDRALDGLPAPLREAVILRYLEGRKQEEAARLAGCPQGTLARRAMEGLDRLRTLLARRGTVLAGVALAALLAQEAQAAAVPVQALAALKVWSTGAGLAGKSAAPAGGVVKAAVALKAAWAPTLAALAVAASVTVAVLPRGSTEPLLPRTERVSLVGHDDGVFAVALSADGQWAATASGDRTVKLWDAASGKVRATLRGHSGKVETVAISPDGLTVASGDANAVVKLWDVSTGRERLSLTAHVVERPGEGVHRLAFSPDGRILATASWKGIVLLWDAKDGRVISTLRGHDSGVAAISFSPDGCRILTASNDRTVRLWDVATGAELARLTGHTQPAHAAACAPDGQTAASGAADGTVIVWDLATGKARRTWQAHTDSVNELAFSPDGRTLASAGGDWNAKLWDPATGAERAVLRGHVQAVTSVSFSADGRNLATASYDRTAKLWCAPKEK